MTEKSEALRLADSQDCVTDDNCGYCMPCSVAAELRRLNEEVETNGTIIQYHEASIARLTSQRDALLEALRELLADAEFLGWDTAKARAAIKAVEENT